MAEEQKTVDPYEVTALGRKLVALFEDYARNRVPLENEWLKDLRQYVGQYEPEVLQELTARKGFSKAFIRLTRTKVKTLDARIGDLSFGSGKQNWSIKPTPVPELAKETGDPTSDLQIARATAEKMQIEIADQLAESKYRKLARLSYHSGHLFGHGILKGALVETRFKKKWAQKEVDGGKEFVVQVEEIKRPYLEFCSVWDFYHEIGSPDFERSNAYFQRHLMTKAELARLARRPDMDAEKIRAHIEATPDGDAKWENWETELLKIGKDNQQEITGSRNRYEIIELWGWVDLEDLKAEGTNNIPEDATAVVAVNVWFFRHTAKVFRRVINPYSKQTRPYSFYVPEPEEGRPSGLSAPFILRDTQALLNGAVRMMVDNGAFSAGPQIEIELGRLVDPKDINILRPFRIWATKPALYGNSQIPVLRFNTVPNNGGSYMAMINVFKSLSDEASAIPSFQHGAKSPGVGRTASGLQMLMGAAALMMKDQLEFWDEFQSSVIEKLYDWNMQFSLKAEIKGDFNVVVVASHSLSLKEQRAIQIERFVGATANPLYAPFVKQREVLADYVEALDADPAAWIKTKEDMEIELQQMQQQPEQQPLGPGIPPAAQGPEVTPGPLDQGQGPPLQGAEGGLVENDLRNYLSPEEAQVMGLDRVFEDRDGYFPGNG